MGGIGRGLGILLRMHHVNVLHRAHVAIETAGRLLAAQQRGLAVEAGEVAGDRVGQLELLLDLRIAVAEAADLDDVLVAAGGLAAGVDVPVGELRVLRQRLVVTGVAAADGRILLTPEGAAFHEARLIVTKKAVRLAGLERLAEELVGLGQHFAAVDRLGEHVPDAGMREVLLDLAAGLVEVAFLLAIDRADLLVREGLDLGEVVAVGAFEARMRAEAVLVVARIDVEMRDGLAVVGDARQAAVLVAVEATARIHGVRGRR